MSHFLDLVIGVDDEGTDDEYTYIESSTWTCEADDKAECKMWCSDENCEYWNFIEKNGEWFCHHNIFDDPIDIPVKYGECSTLLWLNDSSPEETHLEEDFKPRAGKHEVELVWDGFYEYYEWKYAKEETE